LAQKLWDQRDLAGAYNFGPETNEGVPVRDVVELARQAYGAGEARYAPSDEGPHEAAWLALDIAKARSMLGVAPVLTLTQAVTKTMAWYRAQNKGADATALCHADIDDFVARSVNRATPDIRLCG
jgi:CDP-glucose 4,6-dehydratase